MKNKTDKIYYVYAYLDSRKPGNYSYGRYKFDYEPFYIGKGKKGRAFSKNRGNKFLQRRIKKSIPIIIFVKRDLLESAAFSLEKKIIFLIGRNDLGRGTLCNFTDGGEGISGRIVSLKTRKKMGNAHKGRSPSEETRKKIFMSNTGKIMSELSKKKMAEAKRNVSLETRKKISIANKGRIFSEETRMKMSESKKNISFGTRRKISEAGKGREVSKETRIKISNTLKGHPVSKKVREILSLANKGKILSAATRKKMSESGKISWDKKRGLI